MLFFVECISTILSVNVLISMLLWMIWRKFLERCFRLHPLRPFVESNPCRLCFGDHNLQLPVCYLNLRLNSFITCSLCRLNNFFGLFSFLWYIFMFVSSYILDLHACFVVYFSFVLLLQSLFLTLLHVCVTYLLINTQYSMSSCIASGNVRGEIHEAKCPTPGITRPCMRCLSSDAYLQPVSCLLDSMHRRRCSSLHQPATLPVRRRSVWCIIPPCGVHLTSMSRTARRGCCSCCSCRKMRPIITLHHLVSWSRNAELSSAQHAVVFITDLRQGA